MSAPSPREAADRVEAILRHTDLTTAEVEVVRVLRDHARATDQWADVDRATSLSLARRVAELEARLGIAEDGVPNVPASDDPRETSSLFRLTWRVHQGSDDLGYCRVLGDAPDCHAAVRLDVDVDRHHVADDRGRPDFRRIAHEVADALNGSPGTQPEFTQYAMTRRGELAISDGSTFRRVVATDDNGLPVLAGGRLLPSEVTPLGGAS